jgi:two-component system, OmpR family, phosphate regulon sensor histidine kinase PhoR
MLKQNDENGDSSRPRTLRLIAARLRDARSILAVSLLGLLLLTSTGSIRPSYALGLGAAIALACAWPRHSATMRLAQQRRRELSDMSWRRAIELPLDAMAEAAYLLRGDGTVKYQNAAAIRLFGRADEDAHLSARIRSPDILGIVQQAGEADEAFSVEHIERVPSERWFEVRCAPIRGVPQSDARGRLFLLSFRDLTEARRMDRMRTDFVANASHELRTPLASLLGFIETIQGPARGDPAAQARFLDIMHDQATRMTRLVQDLMSLSRLEMKAHLAPTAHVDLGSVLTHVHDALVPLAEELGVVLELQLPPAAVEIVGERDELIQVFDNLVENACKYGQSGGRVEMRLAIIDAADAGEPGLSGSLAEVTVRDFGPGIAPEHLPRLTERFYRANAESSLAKKGTGLGLAIVKHILTRHRTRLIIRSRQGEGSSFIVRFQPSSDVDNAEK